MQNYNNPSQPPPGYGAPPPVKKGMSTGAKVLVAVLVLVVGGGALLLALGVGGYFWLRSRVQQVATTAAGERPVSGLTGSSSAGADAEPPTPTADQQAAIAGGQTAEWEQQEITWTVPQKWKKDAAGSNQLTWSSPGSWDAAHLIVSISPMSADFPADLSIKAFYSGAEQRKKQGEVDEVKWIMLDGVKGVLFRESSPESPDSPQRLQWMGYRDYKGQKQLVNIMLASQGKYFARHEDAMYGILYSTKLGQ
jgi:hypothetical protein